MGKYGQPITLTEAGNLLTNMMSIKTKFNGPIDNLTKGDQEANRFYCGGDAVYIFGKDSFASLWNRGTGPDDDFIFAVFPACLQNEPGRPTLMVFVYQKGADGQFHLLHDIKSGEGDDVTSGDDGLEHPGGNGTFTVKKSAVTGLYEVPEIIDPNDIKFA